MQRVNVQYTYNLDGTTVTRTAQKKNGETSNVITYDYDTAFHRLEKQRVTTPGTKANQEAGAEEEVHREKKIQGHPSRRIPDQQIVDKTGKTRKVIEVERDPNRKRHKEKLKEYDELGIEQETEEIDD